MTTNTISQKQSNLILGTLLGDAHIRKSSTNTSYITFEQTIKKESYIKYLYTVMKEFVLNEPKVYERIDSRYKTKNSSVYFRTKNLDIFNLYADNFLNKENKKIIPSYTFLVAHFTLEALAYWIMDDGQRVKRGGVLLCTDSFTKEELERLRLVLKEVLNLDTSIHNKKGLNNKIYFRLYIRKTQIWKDLVPSLSKLVHPSYLYKLNIEDNTSIV